MKKISAILAVSAALSIVSAETPPVTIKDNAFWVGDERFYIRGIAYQPGGESLAADPLANIETCTRDVEKFKELGLNTIRVYTIDNTADHDECMSLLSDAGIYLALDVNTPKYSIRRDKPGPSYNDVYLQHVFATVDTFAKYDNTLLFFSGNEVINDDTTTPSAPYVKAVTRDIRQYIAARNYRRIPVGYSAADVESNRFEMAQYMNCGSDDERSDFFAFNDYSWCDPSSFTQSGWDQKVEKYSSYSIPIFLSEFGCIESTRQWGEVASLYSPEMTSVFSGGLVYEYSQEPSGYGIVEINGGEVTELPDYEELRNAFNETPNPSGDGGAKAGEPSRCPPRSPTWEVDSDRLPAIPEPAMKYFEDGAGTGPGLDGPGSQDAGVTSSGEAEPGSSTTTDSDDSESAATTAAPFPTVVSGFAIAVSLLFGVAFM